MTLTNLVLLCQVAGYVVALILSLCIVVPMSLHQDEFRLVLNGTTVYFMKIYWKCSFRGHCLLFSTGIWQETNGQFEVDWASQGFCNYTIFVGLMLFLVSLVQIYRYGSEIWVFLNVKLMKFCFRLSVHIYKGTDSSFLSAFIDVVSSMILCGITIIAALMITLGFSVWCQNMTLRFPS